jgi:hypothetical protein
MYRMFKRGEGPRNTGERALAVIAVKDLDTGDKVLAKATAHSCAAGTGTNR